MATNKIVQKRRRSVAFYAGRGMSAEEIAGETGAVLATVYRDLEAIHAGAADYERQSQRVLTILAGQLAEAAAKSNGRECADIANAMRKWFPADASGSSKQPIVYELWRPGESDASPNP